MTKAGMSGPLDGIRVVDFTSILSGPYASRLLADMGAEVIKIEPPEGDLSRTRNPIIGGYSLNFAHLNSGKKAIALDLKSEAGKAAAIKLATSADVVIENWKPGVAKRLGLDYDSLAKLKPDIIYCAITGFGQKGPNSGLNAFASIVEAMSGFTLAQMNIDNADKPQTVGIMLGDSVSGVWAFAGIQTALLRRERTGLGGMVDVAMHDVMLNTLVMDCAEAQFGKSIRRLHVPLRTQDGFMLVTPITERNFINLMHAIGRSELISDDRFNSAKGRNDNWFELLDLTEEWTKLRTGAECEELLRARDVPCTIYRTLREALDDPHLEMRGSLTPVDFGAGTYRIPNAAFQLSNAKTHVRPNPPRPNQHTEEVLQQILNYSAQQIAACMVEMPTHLSPRVDNPVKTKVPG